MCDYFSMTVILHEFVNINFFILLFYFQEKDQYVPALTTITGECNDDDSKITLTWQKDFQLTFNFRKVFIIVEKHSIFLFGNTQRKKPDNYLQIFKKLNYYTLSSN